MRYFVGISCGAVLGVVSLLVWRYEGQLNEARAEAQQLKTDRDKARDSMEDSLGWVPEGEHFPRPRLDFVPFGREDSSFNRLAESLGFQSIYMYRWRGATLEGWVQFQTENGPVKVDLEVSKRAKQQEGENFDPRAVCGAIVFAFKARKDEINISDCLVAIEFAVEKLDKNGVPLKARGGPSYTLSGAIDARKAGISSPPGRSFFSLGNTLYFGDGTDTEGGLKKYQVYELKINPPEKAGFRYERLLENRKNP